MTTATKTAGCRKTKKMKTELVCPCGRTLEVMVQKNGWFLSLEAVALANRWKLESAFEVKLVDKIPAYCPDCHDTYRQCQCRDC